MYQDNKAWKLSVSTQFRVVKVKTFPSFSEYDLPIKSGHNLIFNSRLNLGFLSAEGII